MVWTTVLTVDIEDRRPTTLRRRPKRRGPMVGGMDVVAILNDPDYLVPPVEPPGPFGTISWLRATVWRFSNGEGSL